MNLPPALAIPSTADIILDTTIIVDVIRDSTAWRKLDGDHAITSRATTPMISVVTQGELFSFALRRRWGAKKCEKLDRLLTDFVTVDVNAADIIHAYAEIDDFSLSLKAPKRMGKNDLWIAATARVLNAWLVTSDKDFDHLAGIKFQRLFVDQTTGHSRI